MAAGPFGLLPTIEPLELLFVGEHGKGKGDDGAIDHCDRRIMHPLANETRTVLTYGKGSGLLFVI
jgi:hypothetical protein